MGETNLAPGFRFRPTDVELVRYYLRRKVMGKKLLCNAIVELDIYKFDPPDLPDKSSQSTGDLKWYFFCPREKMSPVSVKSKRQTKSGYWKSTGKDRDVFYNNQVVGQKRTLVFHYGRSPRGNRTDWVMHEYRLQDKVLAQKNVPQDCYVLCVLYKKNGPGPKTGADYGAPFIEEDWSDDMEEDTANIDPSPSKVTSLVATTASQSCVSDVPPLTATVLPPQTNDVTPPFEVASGDEHDIEEMDQFFDSLLVNRNENQNEYRHDEPCVPPAVDEGLICLEVVDFNAISDFSHDLFIELHDLAEPVITPPDPAQAGSSQ